MICPHCGKETTTITINAVAPGAANAVAYNPTVILNFANPNVAGCATYTGIIAQPSNLCSGAYNPSQITYVKF